MSTLLMLQEGVQMSSGRWGDLDGDGREKGGDVRLDEVCDEAGEPDRGGGPNLRAAAVFSARCSMISKGIFAHRQQREAHVDHVQNEHGPAFSLFCQARRRFSS